MYKWSDTKILHLRKIGKEIIKDVEIWKVGKSIEKFEVYCAQEDISCASLIYFSQPSTSH
jgi:hypothetical protein